MDVIKEYAFQLKEIVTAFMIGELRYCFLRGPIERFLRHFLGHGVELFQSFLLFWSPSVEAYLVVTLHISYIFQYSFHPRMLQELKSAIMTN